MTNGAVAPFVEISYVYRYKPFCKPLGTILRANPLVFIFFAGKDFHRLMSGYRLALYLVQR